MEICLSRPLFSLPKSAFNGPTGNHDQINLDLISQRIKKGRIRVKEPTRVPKGVEKIRGLRPAGGRGREYKHRNRGVRCIDSLLFPKILLLPSNSFFSNMQFLL